MESSIESTNESAAVDGSEITEPTAEPEKKKSGLLVKVILFVVALGGGAAAGFTSYDIVAKYTHPGPAGQDSDTLIEYGQFFELTGMIVNPAESEGKRYLMVNLGLESKDAKVLADVEAKQIVLRDMVIRTLGSLTAEELADIANREEIKTDLLTGVNRILQEKEVDRIYFTQYVLQ
jgi:flagellar FliL protein